MPVGTIKSIDDFGDGGVITQKDLSEINFSGAPPTGAEVGSVVSYEIDDSVNPPKAVDLQFPAVIADPDLDFPQDDDYPGAEIIIDPKNGDLNIGSGQTVIVKGTTVTGSVTISGGGTLVLKSTDDTGAQRATVTGNVTAQSAGNGNINSYKSDIQGSLTFKNNDECKLKGVNIGGDGDIRNSQTVSIKTGTIGGDGDIRNMKNSVFIDDLNLSGTNAELIVKNNKVSTVVENVEVPNGEVTIKNNQGCNYSNISEPNDISSCTLEV
ncbi:MAG: hypothetical protein JKY42_12355 [Flavobacteriales bacterium]|nr:hypothetical protein [Flavobacteriales bacterium]